MKTIVYAFLASLLICLAQPLQAQNMKMMGYNLGLLYPQQSEIPHAQIFNIQGQPCSLDDVRRNPMQLYIVLRPDTAFYAQSDIILVDTVLQHVGVIVDTVAKVHNYNHLCDLPQAEIDSILSLITANSCPPTPAADTAAFDSALRGYEHGVPFLYQPELRGSMPLSVNKNVTTDLATALSALSQPTQMDSMLVVVNYVYILYIYDKRNPVTSTNLDSVASLLAEGTLRGQCADLTHFANLIITQLFPWWGYGVEMTSNSDPSGTESCSVAHVFLGLSNSQGIITSVLDPTVNAVWVDSLTGNALTLTQADSLLVDSSAVWRVTKRYSKVFGQYHAETGPMSQPCVFSVQFTQAEEAQLKAYWVVPDSSDSVWVVKGPWPNFDTQTKYGYYWNQLGFPSNKWANNLLIIRSAICYNPSIGALVAQRYGFTVN